MIITQNPHFNIIQRNAVSPAPRAGVYDPVIAAPEPQSMGIYYRHFIIFPEIADQVRNDGGGEPPLTAS